jgi:hypothetical protein
MLAAHALAAMRQIVRPHVLFVIAGWNHRRPGLQQHHVEAAFGENFGGGAAGGAGADNAYIVNLGRADYLEHEVSWS